MYTSARVTRGFHTEVKITLKFQSFVCPNDRFFINNVLKYLRFKQWTEIFNN